MNVDEAWVYEWLEREQVEFERLDHVAITSVRDLPFTLPGQQVKNLVLKTKKNRQFYLVLLHDEKSANLNQLAELLGEKRLSFAHEADVERLLHVPAGTVTPFGLKYDLNHELKVIVDQAVDRTTTVGFHPFVNTTTLNIPFAAFERFLEQTGHDYQVLDL